MQYGITKPTFFIPLYISSQYFHSLQEATCDSTQCMSLMISSHNILTFSNCTHPNNFPSSGFCCKHAENSRATADVKHYLVSKQMPVVIHRVTVRQRPNFVFQHLLQSQDTDNIIIMGMLQSNTTEVSKYYVCCSTVDQL